MKMKDICLSLCLLLAITGTGYCQFTNSYNGLTLECEDSFYRIAPGNEFYVKCSTTEDNIDDVIIGKIKVYGRIDQNLGIGLASTGSGETVWPIYNGTHLKEGRYTVEKDATSVKVTVTDAQPEDSGIWVCSTTDWPELEFANMPQCNNLVVGGVENITISNRDTQEVFGDGDVLVLGPDDMTISLGILIEMFNVAPQKIEILIAGEDVTSDFDTGAPSTFFSVRENLEVLTLTSIYYYDYTYKVNENLGNTGLVVNVYFDPIGGVTSKTLNILSKGKPYSVSCTPLAKEADQATITCEGYMYPVGNVTWSTPQGEDVTVSQVVVQDGNRNFENIISDAHVKSTLTINVDGDTNLTGPYQASFQNEYGKVSAIYEYEDERCRPDQFTCANGQCVEGYQKCNGQYECNDLSDEADCELNPTDSGMTLKAAVPLVVILSLTCNFFLK